MQQLYQAIHIISKISIKNITPAWYCQVPNLGLDLVDFAGKGVIHLMEKKVKYQVGGRGSVFVLVVLFLLYMLNFADRALMSIVVEPMKQALNFNDAQIGATQSIFLLGVALLMIPGSILVERWSRRKMLGLMAIVWSLATLATGMGTKLW